jgi:hypothetical protein
VEFFESRLGDEEVAEVDGVEGTAEDPDFLHRRRLTGSGRFGDVKAGVAMFRVLAPGRRRDEDEEEEGAGGLM